jgi:hypothetical protein
MNKSVRQLSHGSTSTAKTRMRPTVLSFVLLAVFCAGCHPANLPGFRQIALSEQERITRQTEEAITKSPKLQELSHLCTKEIPLPADFKLIKLHRDVHAETFLGYGYHSDLNYEQIKTLYREHFLNRGWRLTEEKDRGWGDPFIEFRNENYRVKIYNFGPGTGVNYSFHCEKLPPPSNNTP